jgi:hypothetical protein
MQQSFHEHRGLASLGFVMGGKLEWRASMDKMKDDGRLGEL